jgi:hypothetical protein
MIHENFSWFTIRQWYKLTVDRYRKYYSSVENVIPNATEHVRALTTICTMW